MVLIEFDCRKSATIDRVALNKQKNELVVIYKGNLSVYLYNGFDSDEIERALATQISKDRTITKIRSIADCKIINGFPTDTKYYIYPKSKKIYKNYSQEWLTLLENSTSMNLSNLQNFIQILKNCSPYYPPSVAPPKINIDIEIPMKNDIDTNLNSNNMYTELDNESEDTSSEITAEDQPKTFKESVTNVTIQTRYLIIKIKCSITESFRKDAIQAQKAKNYDAMEYLWIQAWNEINSDQSLYDEWYSILLAHDMNIGHVSAPPSSEVYSFTESPYEINSNTPLPPTIKIAKQHDWTQLRDLFRGLRILIEDTLRERNRAVSFLTNRVNALMAKLDPLLRDRNAVKAKIGNENWKSNPNPKQTYAERRKAWEQELEVICRVKDTIERLVFHAVPDSI